MIKQAGIFSSIFVFIIFLIIVINSSCANIIPPGGGPRDTLPPVLVSSLPKDSLTLFNAKKNSIGF